MVEEVRDKRWTRMIDMSEQCLWARWCGSPIESNAYNDAIEHGVWKLHLEDNILYSSCTHNTIV